MEEFVTISVVWCVLGVILWIAQKAQPHVDPTDGALIIQYPPFIRALGLFCAFGLPLAFTVFYWVVVPADERDVWIGLAIFAMFTVFGLPFWWEGSRYCLRVSSEGLDCRPAWRGPLSIPWPELEELAYSSMNMCFIARGKKNQKIRISCYMGNLSRFLEECERRLPPSAMARAKMGYYQVGRSFPE